LLRERARPARRPPFGSGLRALPRVFWLLVLAVGVFSAGVFNNILLVLCVSRALAPAYGTVKASSLVVLLYTIHNVLYAAGSWPVGQAFLPS